jgi:biopolymer transport protein ExbD
VKLARCEPRKARIEIIPMIDTVFFLLVFFMMASLAMTVYRGMPVNLPRAASGQPTRDDNAAITLARDGQTYLNREPTTREALGDRLRALRAANPGLVVMINADGEVLHRRVVDIVDVARTAGIARLAIAVAPTGPPQQR